MKIINPETLASPRGYNHGVVASGNFLCIAGQVGWDKNMRLAPTLAQQFEQALRNILDVVQEAGGKPENISRFTIFIKDKLDYLQQSKEIGLRYRTLMGKHFPAMSLLIVNDLLEDGAMVEIEATAIIP
jgi:enamine deaminase RidA (YjgF/YER057c/UK114 family)